MPQIHTHHYENGLTLLVEPMAGVESAGMTLLLPAGATSEPADRLGVAPMLSEMIFRGAGDLDARAHSDALDRLGVDRSAAANTHHIRLGARMLGSRLDQALPLLLDMVRRPQLPEQAFDPARQLAIQEIDALEDEPQRKVMIALRRRHLPEPFGRSTLGDREHLTAMDLEDVRAFYRQRFVPDGAILALAGHVDFERVKDQVGRLLEQWSGRAPEPEEAAPAPRHYHHLTQQTTQQHIGAAYDAVPLSSNLSMSYRLATAVLSGGMSGRLFTEVREKRGLCYAVQAAYRGGRDRGDVYAYAGTTTERAEQTLEVLTAELKRLAQGVDRDEFERAVVGLKSRVVMQGESTSARAAAAARDQYQLGHPRTLDEMTAEIEGVSFDDLNTFVAEHAPQQFTTLTIGPHPLGAQKQTAT